MVTELRSNSRIISSIDLKLTMPDGAPVTLIVAEVYIYSDKVPIIREMRQDGATLAGCLLFLSESPSAPKAPVIWAIGPVGLSLEMHPTEEHPMKSGLAVICKDAIFTLLRRVADRSTHIGNFDTVFKGRAEEALTAYLERLEQAGWPPGRWEHTRLEAVMQAMERGEYGAAYSMLSPPVVKTAAEGTDVPAVAMYRARLEFLRRTPIAKQ